MTSNLFNYAAKLIFASPRPYWLSSHVRALWLNETSFGIPSGHAQIAASVWGMVAVYYKRFWVWAVALTVIFLIGVSRVFLGAHFPHDVVFGWLLGAAILSAFAYLGQSVGAWLGKKRQASKFSLHLRVLCSSLRWGEALGLCAAPIKFQKLGFQERCWRALTCQTLLISAGSLPRLELCLVWRRAQRGLSPRRVSGFGRNCEPVERPNFKARHALCPRLNGSPRPLCWFGRHIPTRRWIYLLPAALYSVRAGGMVGDGRHSMGIYTI